MRPFDIKVKQVKIRPTGGPYRQRADAELVFKRRSFMNMLRNWRSVAVLMVVLTAVGGLAAEALGCPGPNCDADTEDMTTPPCKTASGCNSDCDAVKCTACSEAALCYDPTVSCGCYIVHQVLDDIWDTGCASNYRCHCLIECHYNE